MAPIFLGRATRARRNRKLSARALAVKNSSLGWVGPSLGFIAAVPKFFQPGQEAFSLRMGSGLADGLEFAQHFLLALGQLDRGLDCNLDIKIAALGAAQHRHALGLQAELAAALGAFGNGNL